jgi:hypothetical protein
MVTAFLFDAEHDPTHSSSLGSVEIHIQKLFEEKHLSITVYYK